MSHWPIPDPRTGGTNWRKAINIVCTQVYQPTTKYYKEKVEEFYEDVQKAVDQTESNDVVMIMGNMNAKGNSENDQWKTIAAKQH